MAYESVDFFYNTKEQRIVEANPTMRDYAATKQHLIPCDEEGRALKVDDPGTGNEEVRQLEAQLLDAQTEIAVLKEELRQVKGEEAEEEEPEEPKEGDGPSKIDLLVAAIGELEDGNPTHFTSQGIPRTEILETFSGFDDVSSKERDEAWERYNS